MSKRLFPYGYTLRALKVLCILMMGSGILYAGDILRGGVGNPGAKRNATAKNNAGSEAANQANVNARDRLAKTTQAIQAVRNMQQNAAVRGAVPNGLQTGGLKVLTGANARWVGASAPTQNGNEILIKQNDSKAVLHWETFNVGRETTVNFDQSQGGADRGKWIAFNKIFDPSGRPSQILGSIKADGQVYLLNQNGIIFGSGSQVSTRTLVASSLAINDNLIERGLLNHEAGKAEFLFSNSAQGSVVPPVPLTPDGRSGSIIVEAGAVISAPVSGDGNGGRVVLAGPTVRNEGVISTPSGQTILAAGLQVGFDAHASSDPSLRGLDVYIGSVGSYGGLVVNTGLVEIPSGNLTMAGKTLEQRGAIDSTTTVTLNGRIDLLASYDALPNTGYDPANSGGGELPFLHRKTGSILMGEGSATRILPDLLSKDTTVGTKLPLNSQVNMEGLDIYFAKNAMLQAPSGDIRINAGQWGPVTQTVTDGVVRGSRPPPDFVFTGGQVYLEEGSFIDAAGTTDVFVPLGNSIMNVQLRGNELAVAPLQRDSSIRGLILTIDLRRSGSYYGRNWIGTPLGDTSGFANILQKTAGQLTVAGGSVAIQAGSSVVAQKGSVIDVSGGYSRMEGGYVETSRLRIGANLVDIDQATPDRLYDSVYSGTSTRVHQKWGVFDTFAGSLSPTGAHYQNEYIEGAQGGSLRITAAAMALDGELQGRTIDGPRQLRADLTTGELAGGASLRLAFKNQSAATFTGIFFPEVSPTPPTVIFGDDSTPVPVAGFTEGGSSLLAAERLEKMLFPTDFFAQTGFSSLDIENSEGDFEVVQGKTINLLPEGTLTVTARNIALLGSIRAPGGILKFTAYNLSPLQAKILQADSISVLPSPNSNAGVITLGPDAVLDASGLIVDDRFDLAGGELQPFASYGGSVSLVGYSLKTSPGSLIDVSGGIAVNDRGRYVYGDAGAITLEAGQDPNLGSLLGGKLALGGEVRGYSGSLGGTLAIKAPLIQVGGEALRSDSLLLQPEFFDQGGFSTFNLTGIGAVKDAATGSNALDAFVPAVYIAPGTILQPRVEGLVYRPADSHGASSPLVRYVQPYGERAPVNLGFFAESTFNELRDPVTGVPSGDLLMRRGDIVLSQGAHIITEPGGKVTFDGSTVAILGSVSALGGEISITGARSFPLNRELSTSAVFARPTVYVGSEARLSAAGTTVLLSDPFGRRTGYVLDGGSISISGNIVAESGALLDVSGTSGVLDFHPSQVGLNSATNIPLSSGLTSRPYSLSTVPVVVDSDGGRIELAGAEMLYSDATLEGRAGGLTGLGGTLSVSSGRFYQVGAGRTGADINLIVTQDGSVLPPGSPRGIGLPVVDASGTALAGIGHFSVAQFERGGFDSLDLGFNYDENAAPIPVGGNVQFVGPVSISARGNLRVAGGGVIRASAPVSLSASYLAIGQAFRPPLNPEDTYVPFRYINPATNSPDDYFFAPTTGAGSLQVSAGLIDVGTVSLQGIGAASLTAANGDIRGSGTFGIAGHLSLTAAQIYPTTLARFDIFAYDSASGPGSVTITSSGRAAAPLSAGGSLGIYSSVIKQGGVLLAPFGSISLGWNGTDTDPSDTDLDKPRDPVAGTTIAPPIASQVTLQSGSVTSVAGIDFWTGEELIIPFGLSPDGTTFIDPRGVNVTVSGLPQKSITVSGESVSTDAGSVIDLRGGGDLFGYRWVAGNGGPIDLLGVASKEWSAGSTYKAGDLVSYNGQTWSARVAIDPVSFAQSTGPTPKVSPYWSQVQESFAIVPSFNSSFAPYAAYNTGTNASLLGGDGGYISDGLALGDQIYLKGVSGLAAGTYTLLPRRYALMPGAYLVTPQDDAPFGTYVIPEGATITTGIRSNSFNQPSELSPVMSVFEVAPADVVAGRGEYQVYDASQFIADAAERLELAATQRLPIDSGYLSLHGNSALRLDGNVFSRPLAGNGRGSRIDISSFADITIIGGNQAASGSVVLNASLLNSFGAGSLLIGGQRHFSNEGTSIEVRTKNLTVNNAGSALTGSDITLVATDELVLQNGSQVLASGSASEAADPFALTGRGALVRVSSDAGAQITRSSPTTSALAKLTIGAGVRLGGSGVILDSSHAFSLSPEVDIAASALTFGAGQISIVLDGSPALSGSVIDSHLVLSGSVLQDIQRSGSARFVTYQHSIDIYGSGSFGSSALSELAFHTGEIRGFANGGGDASFTAAHISLTSPRSLDTVVEAAPTSGSLVFNARRITVGAGDLEIEQYGNVILNATGGVLFDGKGGLYTQQNLTANTPVLVASSGSTQNFVAGGILAVNKVASPVSVVGGLGGGLSLKGTDVSVSSDIYLPTGLLNIHATSGDVNISGRLDTGGIAQTFYDVTRYSDGGHISLVSDGGDVTLQAGSVVAVAAQVGGGDAGLISIRTPVGAFNSLGQLLGGAGAGGLGGSFELDTGSLASFSGLSDLLTSGGFNEVRSFRLRNGDIVVDGTTKVRSFYLSSDRGSITVTGTIDVSGLTGGTISLIARDNLTLASGALLDASGTYFSNAGKGGEITLEAGAQQDGIVNTGALLDIQSGSTIDLGVDSFVAGSYTTPGSSAFYGNFTGTLHLRAPRVGNDVRVDSLDGNILGASSILVEAAKLYDRTGVGTLNEALRDTINAEAAAFMNAGYSAMHARLLANSPNAAALDAALVIAPGAEIINRSGDLVLGTPTSSNTADWDLSSFRYGPKAAPGVLTIRASGDIVFNNALSDGFTPVSATLENGNSRLWLATLMAINPNLPINTQSWSYRLTAGADLGGADFRSVLSTEALDSLNPGLNKGSLLVGEFYPAVPNSSTTSGSEAVGANGQTNDSIAITGSGVRTRYEVIRTGTGNIDVNVGRDIQLRNQFATIYTAGVALQNATQIFEAGDFVVPIVDRASNRHPNQGGLGAIQQRYAATYAMAGGNLSLNAQGNIGRFTLYNGNVIADSSRQIPTHWLYRRGYVDPATGLFGVGGVDTGSSLTTITDSSASTTWWIDYSNFFEGFGALGGGNITMVADKDIINADAVIPTNARMAGRDPTTGLNLAPDADNLLEHGGGDLVVRAGGNVDGGSFYVERGNGTIFAGNEITTNSARSLSRGILAGSTPEINDPLTWQPTTLYGGRTSFDVSARGNILLGPVTNAFFLPQGLNNKFWYKTQFNTLSADSKVDVTSYGGDITHRLSVTMPNSDRAIPILQAVVNQFALGNSSAGYYQPWIRLAEGNTVSFETILSVGFPTMRSTAFGGDINVAGTLNLFPSPTGGLEFLAAGSLVGLQPTGKFQRVLDGALTTLTAWSSARINVSDADPDLLPGITSPLAYQQFVGRSLIPAQESSVDALASVSLRFRETGSFSGSDGAISTQSALHATGLLHANDPDPIRIYAGGGDISALTLFASKQSQILAQRDITDIAFYLQNVGSSEISIVSAGRDIIPYNDNSVLRSVASDISQGNQIIDPRNSTVLQDGNGQPISTSTLAGDIQIGGPGVLEVLAGRNLDLGTGANFTNGTGVGITSVGRSRNPFLPFEGAGLVAMAGIGGFGGGPAIGLSDSEIDFQAFYASYVDGLPGLMVDGSASLSLEQQAILALDSLFEELRRGKGTPENYATIAALFGDAAATGDQASRSTYGWGPWENSGQLVGDGEILTRARDIRTTSGGAITVAAPQGGVTMASDIFGNPLTPPGIVTEYGGPVSIFTHSDLDIGQARIFTLRGGDLTIWSSEGDIAAGSAPKTIVTAPPTRVSLDSTSAEVQTDLGGLATGGGIGVLASARDVEPGDVFIIAPRGTVDAGDAGIRATGDINVAAVQVLNADNIAAGGTSTGVPSAPPPAAVNIGGLTAASNASGAASSAAESAANQSRQSAALEEPASTITVEVLGYGGDEEEEAERRDDDQKEEGA